MDRKTQKESRKNECIVNFLKEYHPDFRNIDNVPELIRHINVEKALEELIPLYNKKLHLMKNNSSCDYNDGTEFKSAANNQKSANTWGVRICGLKNKTGDLRVIISNPDLNTHSFFYVPYDFWCCNTSYHKDGPRLDFNYNRIKDSWGKFDQFQVDTLKELALMEPKGKNNEIS